MTRRLLILAFGIIAAASPALAGDPAETTVSRTKDLAHFVHAPGGTFTENKPRTLSVSDAEPSGVAAEWERRIGSPREVLIDPVTISANDASSYWTSQENEDEENGDQSSDCFHGACYCDGCDMGSSCYCAPQPCCTTDQYCQHHCQCAEGNCYRDEDGHWLCDDGYCDVYGRTEYWTDSAVRFGGWGVETDGDPTKIGEYQSLDSSPFWDFDRIWSDGERTLNYSATGLDNEATNARLQYYTPGLSTDVEYQRFLRRWDHDPLHGGTPASTNPVVSEDLNVGEEYAIRVQELDASFEGYLANNIKWKLNLWGLRKFGERQANSMAHCFDQNFGGDSDNRCHVLSQRQQVDWLTMEIEPVVEARFEYATVEYSRTMRAFVQDDQSVTRSFTHFGPFGGRGTFQTEFPYAIVPENFTQIDRVKVNAHLTPDDQLYAHVYHGDTENNFRETNRVFDGFDARWTNRSIDGLSLTTYAKLYKEDNEFPPFFLPEEGAGEDIRPQIDYMRTRAGVRGRWRPFNSLRYRGFSLAGGYEYYRLDRDEAVFPVPDGVFVQPDTVSHQVKFGPAMRWSSALNTYVRYRGTFIEDPLIGVREADGRLNTNLPEQEHRVEIGGTWNPRRNFLVSAQFGMTNSWHSSEFADFDEDDYPIIATVWYAPTDRLSLTGGYGFYSNWIDQDITLGFRDDATETTRWNYGGTSQVVSLNSNYAVNPRLRLVNGVEWVRGNNRFSLPPSPAGADWSLLPLLSDVIVETTRYQSGVDYEIAPGISSYFRYNYFDYEDKSEDFNSGTAHMALGGVAIVR